MAHDRHQDATTSLERLTELAEAEERKAILGLILDYAGRKDLSESDQSLLKHLYNIIYARSQS